MRDPKLPPYTMIDDPRRHRASQQMPDPLRGAWYLTPIVYLALKCGDAWSALCRRVRR